MKSTICLFTLLLGATAAGSATELTVSLAGQFSSLVTQDILAAPNASWMMNFNLDAVPTAGNADQLGFDASFSAFSYHLNGSTVSFAPESIRFSTAGNFGLFTVYFGPESGYDGNGNAIPEFSFSGAQAFSGPTSGPTILAGTYPLSSWNYSDALNYDDHTPATGAVSILTSIPEPSSFSMLAGMLSGLVLILARAKKSREVR